MLTLKSIFICLDVGNSSSYKRTCFGHSQIQWYCLVWSLPTVCDKCTSWAQKTAVVSIFLYLLLRKINYTPYTLHVANKKVIIMTCNYHSVLYICIMIDAGQKTNAHAFYKQHLFLRSGIAYLCGHLHQSPFVPRMHAVHNEGLLELELGDWKYSRK